MTSEKDDDNLAWPREQAERVKLFLSRDCDTHQEKCQSEQRACVIRFDENRHILAVSFDGDSKEDAIDVIDPNDIVGVNVEIKLNDPDSAATCTRDREQARNLLSHINEQEDRSHEPTSKLAAANEPLSEVPVNTESTTILSIFVYPKRKPGTRRSTLRLCGTDRNDSETTKTEIVGQESIGGHQVNLEPKNFSTFGRRYAHHRQFIVAPVEDLTDLSVMVNAIRNVSQGSTTHEEERVLVIVNPCSGKKLGSHIYDTTLRPMLEQAGISHDCLITAHTKHAEERMKKQCSTSDFRDISEYTGIVIVGGDGTIHEAMQGIHRRSDRDKILERVKFGAIGAGTSNGFSASLAHASMENYSPLDSAFMIVRGMSSLVDLSLYETKSTSYTSFLTFSWAMIADIDIESECIRWVGFLRMDIWAVVRVLFLRRYRAKFSYLPPTKDKTSSIPPINEPIPISEGWVTCEDDFILFWASQVTHSGEQMFSAPACKLNDGVFHIMIVRGNISRIRLALILLSMEHGAHVGMNGVEFVKCSAYRLEPITKGSFNDLDGEVIEAGSIQAAVSTPSLRAYCNPQ